MPAARTYRIILGSTSSAGEMAFYHGDEMSNLDSGEADAEPSAAFRCAVARIMLPLGRPRLTGSSLTILLNHLAYCFPFDSRYRIMISAIVSLCTHFITPATLSSKSPVPRCAQAKPLRHISHIDLRCVLIVHKKADRITEIQYNACGRICFVYNNHGRSSPSTPPPIHSSPAMRAVTSSSRQRSSSHHGWNVIVGGPATRVYAFVIDTERINHWAAIIYEEIHGVKLPAQTTKDGEIAFSASCSMVPTTLPLKIYREFPSIPRLWHRMILLPNCEGYLLVLKDNRSTATRTAQLDPDDVEGIKRKLDLGKQRPKWYHVPQD
ncbi:hypothetical protein EVG20_g1428 [Dentipellis fragilis]|uniref:Uncharacterized protein n=1 Tax=Dentipellis fragilis TaxID=205917 RepID=A0A4Y9ZCM9_9AGAM|nr:hypothetical protein EVG20_g1428 [Dentipellis fragilis]